MLIAIVGTRCAGKSTVENYLVSKGFTPVRLARADLVEPSFATGTTYLKANSSGAAPYHRPVTFASPEEFLSHVTRNWRQDFVTVDLNSSFLVNLFSKRPFFMLVSVDAPLLLRYHRSQGCLSLEDFVRQDDECVFGLLSVDSASSTSQMSSTGLRRISHLVKLNVTNTFQSLSEFHIYLESLDMTNIERLRPQWDTYFMTLAELASQRSNCMKRRVGAILVRDHRIVATGYNGTPRGLKNCLNGGCTLCNQTSSANDFECLCLHAEENALLEAGRDRVGNNAILYCNTCPCLKCTIKIIQCGVKTVVYNLSYKVDEASARLFQEAGVEIRRHVPPGAP